MTNDIQNEFEVLEDTSSQEDTLEEVPVYEQLNENFLKLLTGIGFHNYFMKFYINTKKTIKYCQLVSKCISFQRE